MPERPEAEASKAVATTAYSPAPAEGATVAAAPATAAPPDLAIRTFVLRAGRMTDGQRAAQENLGPKFIVPFVPSVTDLHGLFGNDLPVVMEIGFGMGQATWRIARDDPGRNFLGVEVHSPGVGRLLMEIGKAGLSNLRIIQHDAVEVLERMVAPGSLAALHIFYPDPWPKKRHHKRRLIRPGLAELLASRLAPGGYLYFVTDIREYGESSLEILTATAGLRNRYDGFAPRQEWRPETKFEARGLDAGRGPTELVFERT